MAFPSICAMWLMRSPLISYLGSIRRKGFRACNHDSTGWIASTIESKASYFTALATKIRTQHWRNGQTFSKAFCKHRALKLNCLTKNALALMSSGKKSICKYSSLARIAACHLVGPKELVSRCV